MTQKEETKTQECCISLNKMANFALPSCILLGHEMEVHEFTGQTATRSTYTSSTSYVLSPLLNCFFLSCEIYSISDCFFFYLKKHKSTVFRRLPCQRSNESINVNAAAKLEMLAPLQITEWVMSEKLQLTVGWDFCVSLVINSDFWYHQLKPKDKFQSPCKESNRVEQKSISGCTADTWKRSVFPEILHPNIEASECI